jgi:hypothetical protein
MRAGAQPAAGADLAERRPQGTAGCGSAPEAVLRLGAQRDREALQDAQADDCQPQADVRGQGGGAVGAAGAPQPDAQRRARQRHGERGELRARRAPLR